MAKIIIFPDNKINELNARIIRIKSVVEQNIIDLQATRETLVQAQKRLDKLKSRGTIKLVDKKDDNS